MTLENLGNDVYIYCDGVHTVNTDAVLLSYFAKGSSAKNACDLGSGCGIIPLLWLRENKSLNVSAVEIQDSAIGLLQKSVLKSKAENFKIYHKDLKEASTYLQKSSFDLVTMNPPYKKAKGGVMSDNESANIARFEVACTLKDIVKTAADLLIPSGRLCMCHRPERLCDLLCEMREYGIEPKRLRLVLQKPFNAPHLVLVEGVKGAKGNIDILPPLIMQNEDGTQTQELKEIYRIWRENNNG